MSKNNTIFLIFTFYTGRSWRHKSKQLDTHYSLDIGDDTHDHLHFEDIIRQNSPKHGTAKTEVKVSVISQDLSESQKHTYFPMVNEKTNKYIEHEQDITEPSVDLPKPDTAKNGVKVSVISQDSTESQMQTNFPTNNESQNSYNEQDLTEPLLKAKCKADEKGNEKYDEKGVPKESLDNLMAELCRRPVSKKPWLQNLRTRRSQPRKFGSTMNFPSPKKWIVNKSDTDVQTNLDSHDKPKPSTGQSLKPDVEPDEPNKGTNSSPISRNMRNIECYENFTLNIKPVEKQYKPIFSDIYGDELELKCNKGNEQKVKYFVYIFFPFE